MGHCDQKKDVTALQWQLSCARLGPLSAHGPPSATHSRYPPLAVSCLPSKRGDALMNFRKLYFVGHCTHAWTLVSIANDLFFMLMFELMLCVYRRSPLGMVQWYLRKCLTDIQVKIMTQRLIPNCHHENQRIFLLPYTVLNV